MSQAAPTTHIMMATFAVQLFPRLVVGKGISSMGKVLGVSRGDAVKVVAGISTGEALGVTKGAGNVVVGVSSPGVAIGEIVANGTVICS